MNEKEKELLEKYIENQFKGFEIIGGDFEEGIYLSDRWTAFEVKLKLKGHLDDELFKNIPFEDVEVKHKISIFMLQKYTEITFSIDKTHFNMEKKYIMRREKIKYLLNETNE